MVASLLGRRGVVAGILGFERIHRILVVATTSDPACVRRFELQALSAEELRCLRRFGGTQDGTYLGTATRLAHVLSGEAIGAKFFRAFQGGYEQLIHSWHASIPEAHRRHLALLHLTRVLFLQFVQAKGWLDGREDFLQRSVDDSLRRRRSIHRQLLEPLFFGTLNRPQEERVRAARNFGRIPFLNGGLFEVHALERRYRLTVTNATWRDIFDTVFTAFDFVPSEGDNPGAIAPDMLGRVFERLMHSGTRRSRGSFFTPTSLVRSFLEQCFSAYVAQQLDVTLERATTWVQRGASRLRPLWNDITILDPAVGSGAFLLGALHWLERLKYGGRVPSTAQRRTIIKRHLFGVDKDPMAVRLAELRLWLALVAVARDDPSHIDPLPNLDCLIRQGDSLRDPLKTIGDAPLPSIANAHLQSELRREIFSAHSEAKTSSARRLREVEARAMSSALEGAEDALRRELAECRAAAANRNLFGERQGPDRDVRRRVGRVRERMRRVQRYRDQLKHHGELPWFHYESHFGDVFARGGFDMVVGNPPWVRAERLPRDEREELRHRYRWWQAGHGDGYGHLPDLSQAFLERGLELTKPRGTVGFLLPAKLLTTTYGARAREHLGTATTLYLLADVSDAGRAPFDAAAYPMALIAANVPPPQGHRVHLSIDPDRPSPIAQRFIATPARWILAGEQTQRTKQRLAGFPTVGARVTCHLGLKTGANRIFLSTGLEVDAKWCREAVRGRGLRPWSVASTERLLWPCDSHGAPLPDLPPALRRHFTAHARTLTRRSDYRHGPVWQLFRTGTSTARHRVVWADLDRHLAAVPLLGPTARRMVPLNTCYVAVFSDALGALAFAAWLNSTWMRRLARLSADVARGGYARFNAAVVQDLPLPDGVLESRELADLATRALTGADVQAALDARVSEILDLSEVECSSLLQLGTT